MVNCKKCVYFYEYVNKAGGFLGFCNYWKRQVKYYPKSCKAYKPKINAR